MTAAYCLAKPRLNELICKKVRLLLGVEVEPVHVFPMEFAQLATSYSTKNQELEFAWFLCRVGWLAYQAEVQTGIKRRVIVKNLNWLSEYCCTSVKCILAFIERADDNGLVLLASTSDLCQLIIPGPAEAKMIQPFRRLDLFIP